MGGSPIVKTVTKAVKSVVKPVVETVKPTSSAPERREEVKAKVTNVKKTKPDKTVVSKTKIKRSTRKEKLETDAGMTEVASVRNKRKILLGDTGDTLSG
jgi:hypothetical protein